MHVFHFYGYWVGLIRDILIPFFSFFVFRESDIRHSYTFFFFFCFQGIRLWNSLTEGDAVDTRTGAYQSDRLCLFCFRFQFLCINASSFQVCLVLWRNRSWDKFAQLKKSHISWGKQRRRRSWPFGLLFLPSKITNALFLTENGTRTMLRLRDAIYSLRIKSSFIIYFFCRWKISTQNIKGPSITILSSITWSPVPYSHLDLPEMMLLK